jgi:hypothetical protein
MSRASAIGIVVGVAIVLLLLVAYVIGAPGGVADALPFPLFVVLLLAVNLSLVVAGIISVLTRPDLIGAQRLVWLGIIVLLNPIVALGALLYFWLGKDRTSTLFRDLGGGAAPPVTGSERPGRGS